jgi:hypothetical protein
MIDVELIRGVPFYQCLLFHAFFTAQLTGMSTTQQKSQLSA